MQEFFANGKLLLTGEYVVLDGAVAIGMPSKFGQHLNVKRLEYSEPIRWNAQLHDGSHWFFAEILKSNFQVLNTDNLKLAENIAEVLMELSTLNPNLFKNDSYSFQTKLDFPRNWGLGSSSTLVALLSKFGNVDAFKLSEKTFGGSGYDISCALLPKIQTYQRTKKDRKVSFVKLHQDIKPYIYFIHLNQKQNSREGIEMYRAQDKDARLIKSISDISKKIISSENIEDFEDLLYVHETLISNHLNIPTVHETLFPDYNEGIIKSLGAWGGDFVLVTNPNGDMSYFQQKGYNTILSYDEMIVS